MVVESSTKKSGTSNIRVCLLEQLLLLLLVDGTGWEERAAAGGRPAGDHISAQDLDRPAGAAARQAGRAVWADAANRRRARFRENAGVQDEARRGEADPVVLATAPAPDPEGVLQKDFL